MQVKEVSILAIAVLDRLRPLSEPHLEALMASINTQGLQQPIVVRRPTTGDKGKVKLEFILVSGRHRLEACRRLQYKEIAVHELSATEVEQARLLEIEENLIRHDLNVLDRALHVREYRKLFEDAYGEVLQGGDRKSADYNEENQKSTLDFWSKAAKERLGLAGGSLKRLERITNVLFPEAIDRLRGSKWENNQKALLELCGVGSLEQQLKVLDILSANEKLSMREAIDVVESGKVKAERDEDEQWLRKHAAVIKGSDKQRAALWRLMIEHDLKLLQKVAREFKLEVVPE